jgi:hypothetical protein
MDTGADVFAGRLLDGKQWKDIKKMSLEDNILGGSPDSRAFDSEQRHYNWSQIVWLEKVLSVVNGGKSGPGRTMLFLHAPPMNVPKNRRWENLRENNRHTPKWIPQDECDLTYGTVNHYLSQFLFLCMGYRESELVEQDVRSELRNTDLVFSGHAHRNIEFRVEKEWVQTDGKHAIRMYCDNYSELMDTRNLRTWWDQHRPVIVQTAACGLCGTTDRDPPYFRVVTIDRSGQISNFKVLSGQIRPGSSRLLAIT